VTVHHDSVHASVTAYVGLGANIGDARGTLEGAVAEVAALPRVRLSGISRLYRTRPVGPVAQAPFLNAVVRLEVGADAGPSGSGAGSADVAMALLGQLKALERRFGRVEREHWGPRELDLDLLIFGREHFRVERSPLARSDDPNRPGRQWLEVPHAAAATRLFVLAPLADLAPALEPPGWGMDVATAREHAERLEGSEAVTVVGAWDAVARRWREIGAARS
jgi:2-amino-4-hydroxy-6-hydroxymethyldihydropteridine diphosphokinase